MTNSARKLVGVDALNPQFLMGWHQDDAGRSLWSGKSGLLVLPMPGPRSVVDIYGTLPPSLVDGSNSLSIECDGRLRGTVWNHSNHARTFHFRLHIPRSTPASLVHVRLSADHTCRPAEMGGSEDRRELGFAMIEAEVRQQTFFRYFGTRLRQMWRSLQDNLPRVMCETSVHMLHVVGRFLVRFTAGRWSGTVVNPRRPGVSVIVLDDDTAESLGTCLSSVERALHRVEEPSEILLLSPRQPELERAGVPPRRWIPCDPEADLHELCRQAADAAGHDWLYIVRSHQRLRADTLVEALEWRRPSLFALQSRLEGAADGPGRGEIRQGLLALRSEPWAHGWAAQATLCARSAPALFNRAALRSLLGTTPRYVSEQWHEIEWGVRAWKMGFETLLCAGSVVDSIRPDRQDARGAAAGDDQNERDRFRFHFRNRLAGAIDVFPLLLRTWAAGKQIRKELLGLISLADYARCMINEPGFAFPGVPLQFLARKYYSKPKSRPAVVWVSPFSVFPPTHGGAVRMHQFLEMLARDYAVHLVSDEAAEYPLAASSDWVGDLSRLAGLHLVDGRREEKGRAGGRVARIESHSHAALGETLRMVIAAHQPRLVDVQYMELAGLATWKRGEPTPAPWILTLHDVDWDQEIPGESVDDRYERNLLQAYDHVIVCCKEDADLLQTGNVTVIPNGAHVGNRYLPSPDAPRILFVGPFRASQNLEGIRAFLRAAYPVIERSIRDVRLTIVGGRGAVERVKNIEEFGQEGVEMLEYVEDLAELITQSAVTINPLPRTRGTCLKIAEYLAANRVCVSSRAGARGFLSCGYPSLVVVDAIGPFAEAVVDLLTDVDKRRNLERLDESARRSLSWERPVEQLRELYRAKIAYRSQVGQPDLEV